MSAPRVPEAARLAEASYDAIAALYEHDMARSAPAGDVAFYRARCAGVATPILELACGTGRIGFALAQHGQRVVGLDRSSGMLQEARRRARALGLEERVYLLRGDLRALPLRASFERVICAYSALTYLAEPGASEELLRAVRERLRPGGRFLLDVFVPREELARPGAEVLVRDYERELPDGTRLERSKIVRVEIEPGRNEIERFYVLRDTDGRELWKVATRVRIRPLPPAALLAAARDAGLAVVETCADFRDEAPVAEETRTLALVLARDDDERALSASPRAPRAGPSADSGSA
ncbi:MAG: class I SAM-dependent methyltransferase [Planctomycetes bacterium]|nr:class I SAM-dependent methyltransferase [Planctomycetota bacterium]